MEDVISFEINSMKNKRSKIKFQNKKIPGASAQITALVLMPCSERGLPGSFF